MKGKKCEIANGNKAHCCKGHKTELQTWESQRGSKNIRKKCQEECYKQKENIDF
jgi:hypothetical protein